jgi:hypothetical protein
MSMTTVVGMACQPHRADNLLLSAPVLAAQCGALHIHVNGKVPTILRDLETNYDNIVLTASRENLGDTAKLSGLSNCEGYYLTVDDDILYPPDYVATMKRYLDAQSRIGILCVHGSTFDPSTVPGFIGRRKMYDFGAALDQPQRVLMPGTGTACWHKSVFKISEADIRTPNMLDVWVACMAAEQGIPVISVPRPAGWLKPLSTCGTSICRERPIVDMEVLVQQHQKALQRMHALI